MMTEAYGYTIVVVIAALSLALVRASAIRPTLLFVIIGAGIFILGFITGNVTHHADEGWFQAGSVRPPVQPIGAISGEQVADTATASLANGLAVKEDSRIAIEVFDDAASALVSRPSLQLRRGANLQIAGWAADPAAGAPCKALYLGVGKMNVVLPYGFARSDVASYFHDEAYTSTGFSGKISTDQLPAGLSSIKVECLSATGKTLFVSTDQRTLVIQ
jgi:hypothetical protein